MNITKELINDIANFLETNEDTCRIYISILSKPITDTNLNNNFDWYESKIDFLSKHFLISEYIDERNGGKKIFFATDPYYSFSAILLKEAWIIDSELHSLVDIEKKDCPKSLKMKYKLLCKILPELKNIYVNQLPYNSEIIVVVNGRNKVTSGITSLISEAKKSIVAMVSPPQLMGEVVWKTIEEKMNNGISYLRITDFEEIKRHGYAIASREILNSSEVLYITKNKILTEKYYIIDNQKVAFFEQSNDEKSFLYKAQIIKNAGIANQFYKQFCSVKDSICINFSDILPKMELYRTKAFKQWAKIYNDEMVNWLKDVFDNGVFYSRSNYTSEFINLAIEKGLEDRNISLVEDGNVVINYSLSDVLSC